MSAAKSNTLVLSLAVVIVGCLEAYALYLGHNGTFFGIAIGTIGGIVGFQFGKPKGEKIQ